MKNIFKQNFYFCQKLRDTKQNSSRDFHFISFKHAGYDTDIINFWNIPKILKFLSINPVDDKVMCIVSMSLNYHTVGIHRNMQQPYL